MKSFTTIAALASLMASVAIATPVSTSGATHQESRRYIAAKLQLCTEANLQNCDTNFVPIDTCWQVPQCQVRSFSTGGHICDFYSEPGCGGNKYQHAGMEQDLPEGLDIESVFCW